MATFTPPFDTGLFFPSKGDLIKWVYDIWRYLQANPIVSEETVADIINTYIEEHPVTSEVNSVNGQKGDVVLTAYDIDSKDNISIQKELEALNAADDTKYSADNPPPYPVTSVNGKTGAVTIETGAGDAYTPSNPPPYPVTSVNGKTGAVTIETGAGDAYTPSNPPPYPVTSVFGATGDVSLVSVFDLRNQTSVTVTEKGILEAIWFSSGTMTAGTVAYRNLLISYETSWNLYAISACASIPDLVATVSTDQHGIALRLENKSNETVNVGTVFIFAYISEPGTFTNNDI